MSGRKDIYNALKQKMEEVGFQLEKEQKPFLQNRKENELKFIHPQLTKKLKENGLKINATKYYLKPLSDDVDSEIGFVTGKSTALHIKSIFTKPNSIDSFGNNLAWTNRNGDSVLDDLLVSIKIYLETPSKPKENILQSFLFAWNPNNWEWEDLLESIDRLKDIGYIERRWSCGNSRSIKMGDRVFLMRLSEEPRGIMGSGYAKTSYYVAPHWNGVKSKTTNYIDIEFDVLIDPNKNTLFDKMFLDNVDPRNVQQWFPQQSGISIKQEIVDSLESHWFQFITKNKHIGHAFFSNDVVTDLKETFREGSAKDIIQTRYERNPEARKRCLSMYGYSCKVCAFNFKDHFGEIGKNFVHVHHINQISEIGEDYEIDPMKDLIPVCPNCHSMIHLKDPHIQLKK